MMMLVNSIFPIDYRRLYDGSINWRLGILIKMLRSIEVIRKVSPSQYLMCFIVYSVVLNLRIVVEISSFICYLLLRMAMACWSWSE